MKKILFVASEAVPFIKTGGLADVAGSLPKYFNKNEYDVRVIVPKYLAIPQRFRDQMCYRTHFYMDLGWRNQYVGVLELVHEGVTFYFIDNEYYFCGDKPYGDIHQDIEKFAFFSKALINDDFPTPEAPHKIDVLSFKNGFNSSKPVFSKADVKIT